MKTKLNRIFVLIAIALSGIVLFQIYWTFNAYQVNKTKFDSSINVAMQNAIDDCKKDYFDSIRRVLIKHLSPPETTIRVDTLPAVDTAYTSYAVLFLNKTTLPGEPFITSKSNLAFYRKKIDHPATLPELFTEMSFYIPTLMQQIKASFGEFGMMGGVAFTTSDIRRHPEFFHSGYFKSKPMQAYILNNKAEKTLPEYYQHLRDSAIIAYFKNQPPELRSTFGKKNNTLSPPKYMPGKKAGAANNKADFMRKMEELNANTVYAHPADYRKTDSLKLWGYLKKELGKLDIRSPFHLVVSRSITPGTKSNLHYAETDEVDYKYYGFKLFGIGPPDFFMRAKFPDPQYGVLRGMMFTIVLSIFLILFVIFCFNYIIKTFIEQKKLADLKDDFINSMTHELKTPIATITVAIEGMQKFNVLQDVEKTQRYLQTSRNELSRLNDLVTKVLDIASFENKTIELVKTTIDINLLIEDIIISEKEKTSKLITIAYKKAHDLTYINADNVHFRNVFANLIDNAVKYSKEPVEVIITIKKSANNAVVSVKDNGIGIPQSHLHQVFDKFHRVPTGNIHNVKGTGLGLSYVKYIVEAHGGTIALKSEVNKGSEFVVTIPIDNG